MIENVICFMFWCFIALITIIMTLMLTTIIIVFVITPIYEYFYDKIDYNNDADEIMHRCFGKDKRCSTCACNTGVCDECSSCNDYSEYRRR